MGVIETGMRQNCSAVVPETSRSKAPVFRSGRWRIRFPGFCG